MLYTIVNFTTQCGENRHTDIANFATLIHTKKLIHCVAIYTILYGNYYPPHGEFKLIYIEKFSRRTWVNFTQQCGKNRQRCQQTKFYYAVWQLLLYYDRDFRSKILSVTDIRTINFRSYKYPVNYQVNNLCFKNIAINSHINSYKVEYLKALLVHAQISRVQHPLWKLMHLWRAIFRLRG